MYTLAPGLWGVVRPCRVHMRAWSQGLLLGFASLECSVCCGISLGGPALGHCTPQRCTCSRTTGWWDVVIPNLPVSATTCSSWWLPLRFNGAGGCFTWYQVPDSCSRCSCPGKLLLIPALPERHPQQRCAWMKPTSTDLLPALALPCLQSGGSNQGHGDSLVPCHVHVLRPICLPCPLLEASLRGGRSRAHHPLSGLWCT